MHSSGMHTAHLFTVCWGDVCQGVSTQGVSARGCLSGGFLSRGSTQRSVCLGGGVCPGRCLPLGVSAKRVSATPPPGQTPSWDLRQTPPCGQTDTCENIPFANFVYLPEYYAPSKGEINNQFFHYNQWRIHGEGCASRGTLSVHIFSFPCNF